MGSWLAACITELGVDLSGRPGSVGGGVACPRDASELGTMVRSGRGLRDCADLSTGSMGTTGVVDCANVGVCRPDGMMEGSASAADEGAAAAFEGRGAPAGMVGGKDMGAGDMAGVVGGMCEAPLTGVVEGSELAPLPDMGRAVVLGICGARGMGNAVVEGSLPADSICGVIVRSGSKSDRPLRGRVGVEARGSKSAEDMPPGIR